jgi:predicted DNA-binding transcriptional regulator AlpA
MGRVLRLPTAYEGPQHTWERPVSRRDIAELFGVSTRTVDRWVERDHMPQETNGVYGCWIRVGSHKRFYPSRVREWLAQRN